jgi:glycosyltransferase involved in cell wall biosynthesis
MEIALSTPDSASRRSGALFVMPTSSLADGPVPPWMCAAGWAGAARRLLGQAWILSPEGIFTPEEALTAASRSAPGHQGRNRLRSRLPPFLGQGLRDIRQMARAHRFRKSALVGRWITSDLAFVWQRHEPFHTAGFELARGVRKPLVLFVDAPVVWEQKKWGLRRPGWGRLLELVGEIPQFRAADLLACISDEVASEMQRLGVPEERILVTPNGVDLELFHPSISAQPVRDRLGIEKRFVVGWVGSFRPFHGLEIVLEAAQLLQGRVPDLALLLIGAGPEQTRMKRMAADLNLRSVFFPGTIPFSGIPSYIAAMDVCLVADSGTHQFHYSPLKLREYMACGRAVVAPRVGQMRQFLTHEVDSLLVEPGDPYAIADAVERLYRDRGLLKSIGLAAQKKAAAEGSWDRQVERVIETLDVLPRTAVLGAKGE